MATITITGDLADDPETIQIHGGQQVTRLCVIEKQRRQNPETGEWEDAEPNVYRVQARGRLSDHIAQSTSRGSSVDIVGHIVTDAWTDKETGQKQTAQVVVADEIGPSPTSHPGQVVTAQAADTPQS